VPTEHTRLRETHAFLVHTSVAELHAVHALPFAPHQPMSVPDRQRSFTVSQQPMQLTCEHFATMLPQPANRKAVTTRREVRTGARLR